MIPVEKLTRSSIQWLVAFFIFGFLSATGQVPLEGFDSNAGFAHIQSEFTSPPQDYAPHAFWFWNDAIDPSRATHMAREMSSKHLNPGYAHPRHIGSAQGLPVDQWLTEAYFDCLRGVLDVCEEAGTRLGFCDDYWWPSGRVGGRMVTEHPEMQARELQWSITVKEGPWSLYLPPNAFIVACQHGERGIIKEETLQLIRTGKTGKWEVPEGRWFLYVFTSVPSPNRNRGPDQVLVNYMHPKLADRFIEMGLEPYAKKLGTYMGGALRYCFSDNEGEYGNVLPWSDYMAELSMELYGEDIRRLMPLLLTEDTGGTWVAARYKWFNLVSEIYANHFWKPINDWLSERGLYYVSNFWEADLMLQAATVGDYFRVNRAFSLPGNDALMMGAFNMLHFKEIQSIAEFERRPFMSEIMGVQGWGQTPAEMKMAANLATAWGVTQIVPHGINMDRDIENTLHPADWFEDNPYWETIEEWTNFCRRASFINSQGDLAADVLVYNPMTSIWALSESFLSGRAARGSWHEPMAQRINRCYYEVQKAMSGANMEYLIADDQYILESKLNGETRELELRGHTFNTLIVPPLYAVQTSVYERIVAFARAGGKVVLMGELPVASAEKGLGDAAILKLNQAIRSCPSVVDSSHPELPVNDVCRQIVAGLDRSILLENGALPVQTSHRVIDGHHFYWISNNTGKSLDGTFLFSEGTGRAERWSCETGNIEPVYSEKLNNRNRVRIKLDPYEGCWIVFNATRQPLKTPVETHEVVLKTPFPEWQIELESSTVPVTTASIWIEGENQASGPANIPENAWSRQSILDPFNPLGTWQAEWISARVNGPYGYFIHEFELPALPEAAFLNITADGGMALFINGVRVSDLPNSTSWKTVDTVDIRPYLKAGTNRLGVRAGKNINPGTFWLLAQGTVQIPGNHALQIQTGSDWLMTNNNISGWNLPGESTEAFSPVPTRAWNRLVWTNKTDVKLPVSRLLDEEATVWMRFDIPPGAVDLRAGFIGSGEAIWIDGAPVYPDEKRLRIPEKSSSITIRTTKGALQEWTTPGQFTIGHPEMRAPQDWSNWGMDRFTGFVTYRSTFSLEHRASSERIILDLGEVDFVAQVQVNDIPVGNRMWAPFRFDITDALRDGNNTVSIRVGNLIANRMAVYEDLGQLQTWGNPGRPDSSLFSGGLLGPVRIIATAPETR